MDAELQALLANYCTAVSVMLRVHETKSLVISGIVLLLFITIYIYVTIFTTDVQSQNAIFLYSTTAMQHISPPLR